VGLVMARRPLRGVCGRVGVVAAFGALGGDGARTRAGYGEGAAAGGGGGPPPPLGVRWWRLAAGVCLGLACASKWDGIWFVPAFFALTLAWDVGARRAAGLTSGRSTGAAVRSVASRLATLPVLPLATHPATWAGWFATGSGYDRQWAAEHGIHTPVIAQLVSLFEYHKAMLAFNTGLTTHHPYESKPWTWLLISRPVSYFWCPSNGARSVCS